MSLTEFGHNGQSLLPIIFNKQDDGQNDQISWTLFLKTSPYVELVIMKLIRNWFEIINLFM